MTLKSFGLVSSIALAAALSTPAMAQQDDTTGEAAVGTVDEQQEAANDPGRSNEIIVTAEFREANVQETPIAITAVTADMLEARAQSSVFEIANQAPNVSLRPGGQARSGMIAYIRGIGQTDFIAALEPGVGVYLRTAWVIR